MTVQTRRSVGYDPRLLGGGSVVPYVGQWSGEESPPYRVIQHPNGRIGYSDEMLLDRDEWGVLWVRLAGRIGTGRPLFTKLHPRRQRRAMLRLLCQVCAQPADHSKIGTLWLLPAADAQAGDLITIQPPVCLACARLSVRMCPALRTSHVALRAHSRVAGVTGVVFRPEQPYPRLATTDYADLVPFHDPAIRWTLATQQARALFDTTTVDLDRLG